MFLFTNVDYYNKKNHWKELQRDDIISCNRIAVQDAGTKQISSHHFEIQKEVKDTGISGMMQRMNQLDFIKLRNKFKDLMTNRLGEISIEIWWLKLETIMKPLCR